jgi:hypothetical protein
MADTIEPGVATVCTEYTRLRCAARDCVRRTEEWAPRYAELMERCARFILETAPGPSGPYLDAIKRIMEIDTATTDPNVILMRASIVATDEGSWIRS